MKSIVLATALLLSLGVLAACRPAASTPEPGATVASADETAAANEALVTFFDRLQAGDYAEAAALYGGSYEVLTGYNPEIDPTDVATLWRNGCSINGLNCLKVRSSSSPTLLEPGIYRFDVEFSTREGELFVLRPCCGANETEQPPVSLLPIRVARGQDGRFRVIDLPPYTP